MLKKSFRLHWNSHTSTDIKKSKAERSNVMHLGHCSCARHFSDVIGSQKIKWRGMQFDVDETSLIYSNAIEKTTKLLFKCYIREALSLVGDTRFWKKGRWNFSGRMHHAHCSGRTHCSFHRSARVQRRE